MQKHAESVHRIHTTFGNAHFVYGKSLYRATGIPPIKNVGGWLYLGGFQNLLLYTILAGVTLLVTMSAVMVSRWMRDGSG